MGLDLQMCIVPRQIRLIRNKADFNADYGGRIQFLPGVLRDPNKYAHYFENYPEEKEMSDDAKELKKFYDYADLDFFSEQGRESSTLDYLFDELIDEKEIDLEKGILWRGGEKFASHAVGGQGILVRVYESEEIEKIAAFLRGVNERELLKNYDYEKLSGNVYKLTHPSHRYILSQSCAEIRTLFERAERNAAFVLCVID